MQRFPFLSDMEAPHMRLLILPSVPGYGTTEVRYHYSYITDLLVATRGMQRFPFLSDMEAPHMRLLILPPYLDTALQRYGIIITITYY